MNKIFVNFASFRQPQLRGTGRLENESIPKKRDSQIHTSDIDSQIKAVKTKKGRDLWQKSIYVGISMKWNSFAISIE